jgi:hypothetical protein
MWDAAKSVTAVSEQSRWVAADGLFSALVARAEAPTADGASESVLPRIEALEASLAQLLRLSAAERQAHLPAVYDQLLVCLQAAQSPVPDEGSLGTKAQQLGKQHSVTFDEADLRPYQQDAKAQSVLMWAYSLVAVVLVGVLVAQVLQLAGSKSAGGEGSSESLVGMTILGVLALAAGHQARECRRAAFETRRVHRQLLSLDRYLSPLPAFGQDLLRGVLVQRLFPRMLDDDNPMREDDAFPPMDSLMQALSPEIREIRARKLAQTSQQGVQDAAAPPISSS